MTAQSFIPVDFDAVTTGDSSAPPSPSNLRVIPIISEAERRQAAQARLEEFRAEISSLLNSDLTTPQRLERIISMQVRVLPELMEELLFGAQTETRSMIASRTMQAMRDISSIITKKHDVEAVDQFNARSPKVRAVLGWLIELFHEILTKHTEDEILVSNVFNDFANQLAGWEERTERRLRGVPTRLLSELESPLTVDFFDRVNAATQLASQEIDAVTFTQPSEAKESTDSQSRPKAPKPQTL